MDNLPMAIERGGARPSPPILVHGQSFRHRHPDIVKIAIAPLYAV